MASEWNLSSDDSSCDSNDLPPIVHSSQKVGGMSTVIVKTEPVTCKSEPVSPDISDAENERNNESELFDTFRNSRYNQPHSSLTSGDFPNIRSGDDGSSTLPHQERSPISNDRHGTLTHGNPIPIRGGHTATDHSPYSDDYYDEENTPEAVAIADGLSIRYISGMFLIPYTEVPQRVIYTGPSSIAVLHPDTHDGWMHIPGGITIDERINRRYHTQTYVSLESFQNGLFPPLPTINSVPPTIPIASILHAIPFGCIPPAFPIHSVTHSIPNDSFPPAIPVDSALRAIPFDSVPPAISIDNVPPTIPIDNCPINIKYEMISDDDEDAVNHNMYTDVAADVHNDAATADVYNEVYTDANNEVHTNANNEVHTDANNDSYNDIVVEDLETKENLVLRCIESNQEPVVERSESNEESFEKKCIPLVISSSEHFRKEICQKDPCDPTFGDGFQIDRIMNPKLGDDDDFLFEVQWRHQNFAGIDVLRAPIIYDHWPEVALKFYQERYPKDED